ncbi:MAG: hypothetical protein DMF63_04845 [Acidobacteria bacterium]|nr:MAG: hypothetical protein DMF63_04845 [Acidobacteriota bacterium]
MKFTPIGIVLALLLFSITAIAQVSMTCSGSYTENFSFLGTTNFALTNNSPLGIYAQRETLNTSPLTFFADAGTLVTPAGFRNYGAVGGADRSFGMIAGPAGDTHYLGIRIQNNCPTTATAIQVQYVGKQWRSGSTNPQTVTFGYQVSAGDITDLLTGTYTTFAALSFTTPVNNNAGALDGNAVANQLTFNSTIPISLPFGSEIMLRWQDPDDAGNDHGMGIDNLSVTLLSPTAAGVSVSGRVMTGGGTGIGNAVLVLSGGTLQQPLIARTNPFGYYEFPDVPVGATYLLEISSKRYSFAQSSQVIQPQDNVTGVDFISDGK